MRVSARLHICRADAEGRQPLSVEPDAHGLGPRAFEPNALHVRERAEARLDAARQVIRDLRRRHALGGDADVEGCIRPVGALHLDHGRLDLRRQLATDLIHAVADFGQRDRARMVELETRRHRADPRHAARFRRNRCR